MSLSRYEGYLLIDNRESPGVSREQVSIAGAPFVPAGMMYESAVYTCSHCQRGVVMNPDRSRERGFCRGCNHVICDSCATVMAVTLQCVPFKKIIDDAQEAAYAAQQRGSTIISGS
jgi:hypothetical protein